MVNDVQSFNLFNEQSLEHDVSFAWAWRHDCDFTPGGDCLGLPREHPAETCFEQEH